jgi:hypothetical protein
VRKRGLGRDSIGEAPTTKNRKCKDALCLGHGKVARSSALLQLFAVAAGCKETEPSYREKANVQQPGHAY